MYALPTGPYLWEASKLIGIFLCVLLSVAQDGAGVQNASGYAEAIKEATRRDVPVVLYVHGSDWNQLGERLFEGMWEAPGTWRMLRSSSPKVDLVVANIDTLQSPTPEQENKFQTIHEGWKKQGLVTYPALIALAPDGSVLGSRQGETLPRTVDDARESFLELARAASLSRDLRLQIDEAKRNGDIAAEMDAIQRVYDLPLDRPDALLARLEVIDPSDTSGLWRRESLPPWHTLISEVTKQASEGEAEAALNRLNALLADDAYSERQRAWIHVALGAVYRKMNGRDEDAGSAFEDAWAIDPGGIAGNAGMRWYLRFYSDPSLLFGWAPEHCSGESVSWIVEDLPKRLEPGTYELTFVYTKGRHGLAIDRVDLISEHDGSTLASDAHAGFAGTRNRANVYSLVVTDTIESPRLLIQCRSDGGSNSHGTLVFNGPMKESQLR